MSGQTVSLFGGALKRDYHGPIIDALNNMTPLYRLLGKNEESVSGEDLKAYVPIKTRRNQGIGARAEGAVLPTARYVKTVQMSIPLAYIYGPIEFSGPVIKASMKSPTRFAEVVNLEINSMVEGVKVDADRQMTNGNGEGMLCMTNGAGGGATSTVTVDTPGTQWLQEGMPILSDTSADGSTGAVSNEDISHGLTEPTAHIVKKVIDSTTFMLGTYADVEVTTEKWNTDRYLFRYNSANHEMMGLRGIVDNEAIKATSSWFGTGSALTTVQGLSRATYPILDAVINHNSNTNRTISEEIIQEGLDDLEKKSGKQTDNKSLIILTTPGVRRKYLDLLQADRRYSPETLDLVGGWKGIAYQAGNDKIPMIVSNQMIPNTMLILDRRYLNIYRASNWDWMDYDGSMFQRKIDSSGKYDVYEAMLFAYMTLGCTSFANQLAIRDITE